MDIVDYVYSILKEKDAVLLNAYPGFGKSRIAVAIAGSGLMRAARY
ncbi:hypothetical protein [Vulcanisaeta sp. JCM 14467]|nr:hypothetical protein [Vulcanisaeta sp. JCM 14467]